MTVVTIVTVLTVMTVVTIVTVLTEMTVVTVKLNLLQNSKTHCDNTQELIVTKFKFSYFDKIQIFD